MRACPPPQMRTLIFFICAHLKFITYFYVFLLHTYLFLLHAATGHGHKTQTMTRPYWNAFFNVCGCACATEAMQREGLNV